MPKLVGNGVHPFPDPIDVSSETNLKSEFHRFEKQWKIYAKSADLADDPERAKSTLLTAIGPECSKLYDQQFQITADDTLNCSAMLAAIGRNLIDPISGKLQRRAEFNNQSRYENESYFKFLRRLRQKLEAGCYYGEIEDDVHLDKIISSISNEALSLELCNMDGLTLELAIERCLKEDKPAAQSQAAKSVGKPRTTRGSNSNTNSLHVRDKTQKNQDGKFPKHDVGESSKNLGSKDKKSQVDGLKPHAPKNNRGDLPKKQDPIMVIPCLQCGNRRDGLDHMASPTLCPAHGKKCQKCNEQNHLTSQCEVRRGFSRK